MSDTKTHPVIMLEAILSKVVPDEVWGAFPSAHFTLGLLMAFRHPEWAMAFKQLEEADNNYSPDTTLDAIAEIIPLEAVS